MKSSLWVLLIVSLFLIQTTWSLETKPRLAVVPFTGDSGYCNMLTSLVDSGVAELGRFVTTERLHIDKVLREQALQLSGVIEESTVVKVGNILGAKYIVTGSLISTSGSWEKEYYTASVNATVKIIDVETGKVIGASTCPGKGFEKTTASAYEKALEQCAGNIIIKICAIFPLDSITGNKITILEHNGNLITIKGGRDKGFQPNQIFDVYQHDDEVIDPETGEILEIREKKQGSVIIIEVDEKTSIAKVLDGRYSMEPNDYLQERPGKKIKKTGITVFGGMVPIALSPNEIYLTNGTLDEKKDGYIAAYGVSWVYLSPLNSYGIEIGYRYAGSENFMLSGIYFTASYRLDVIPEYFEIYPFGGAGWDLVQQKFTPEAENYISENNFDTDDSGVSIDPFYGIIGVGASIRFSPRVMLSGNLYYMAYQTGADYSVMNYNTDPADELIIPKEMLYYTNINPSGAAARIGLSILIW